MSLRLIPGFVVLRPEMPTRSSNPVKYAIEHRGPTGGLILSRQNLPTFEPQGL